MNKYQKSCSRNAKKINSVLGVDYKKTKNFLYNKSKKSEKDIQHISGLNGLSNLIFTSLVDKIKK